MTEKSDHRPDDEQAGAPEPTAASPQAATDDADTEGTRWGDADQAGTAAHAEGWTHELARDLRQRSGDRSMWVRLLFMLISAALFLVIYTWLIWFLVVFQFLSKLVTGHANQQLVSASDRLVHYAGELLAFLLYRTEQRPWPFGQADT